MPLMSDDPYMMGPPRSHVITEQPDLNTTEITSYGSAYMDVKAALYLLDQMIEEADERYTRALASMYGQRYEETREILTRKSMFLASPKPKVQSYEEMQAVKVAKEIYRKASTLRDLKQLRKEVEAYGTMVGTQEYGERMLENGLSNDVSRTVFKKRAAKGLTNNYESIKAMREGRLNDGLDEQQRRMERMARLILMANEFDDAERGYPEEPDVGRLRRASGAPATVSVANPEPIRAVADDDYEEPEEGIDMDILDLIDTYSDGFEEEDEEEPEETPADVSEEPEPEEPLRIAPAASSMEEVLGSIPKETPKEYIAPVASSMEDVLKSIPRTEPEREMIGPISEADRARIDALRGQRVERLPPVSSSIEDIMAVMDRIDALDRSDAEDDYIKWMLRQNLEKGRTEEIDSEEDGGVVIIRQEGSE